MRFSLGGLLDDGTYIWLFSKILLNKSTIEDCAKPKRVWPVIVRLIVIFSLGKTVVWFSDHLFGLAVRFWCVLLENSWLNQPLETEDGRKSRKASDKACNCLFNCEIFSWGLLADKPDFWSFPTFLVHFPKLLWCFAFCENSSIIQPLKITTKCVWQNR